MFICRARANGNQLLPMVISDYGTMVVAAMP